MLEAITPYAPLISAGSALISAISVLISTGFIIWTTCFRKTRRDRIDDLKVEMQILLSQGWTNEILKTHETSGFLKSLPEKFQKREYKRLYQCAYNELAYEGKNAVVISHVERAKLRCYEYELAQKRTSK